MIEKKIRMSLLLGYGSPNPDATSSGQEEKAYLRLAAQTHPLKIQDNNSADCFSFTRAVKLLVGRRLSMSYRSVITKSS